MWPNPQETGDLVTFLEEIFNGKVHFLCSRGHCFNWSVLAQLNISSIKNKIEFFVKQVKSNLDVLIISETKIVDSFPNVNFLTDESSKP